MEIFYSKDIEGNVCRLDPDESAHCIKVLRHRKGDMISVIDGKGSLMECRIVSDSPKGAEAEIVKVTNDWGTHPYRLHMAVCPTKNNDRYEWFAEKACEIGVDSIFPVIGEHSEREIFKTARTAKILVSAAKQSLKGRVPDIHEPVSVKDFILGTAANATGGPLKLIAYCFEDQSHPRMSIKEALHGIERMAAGTDHDGKSSSLPEIYIMIGPEGDFSHEEASLAIGHGFIPVHLGASRLRTETAAVTAVEAVYFHYME